MLNLNYTYYHDSARLIIEGLPDTSLGQSSDTIGIITTWKLHLVGFPLLEGKRNHLESLAAVVLPYARHLVSGIRKNFGNDQDNVNIIPYEDFHLIRLRSSKEGVEPLEIKLDDAEFADLVRCLDDLILDKRVHINWNIPIYKALHRGHISREYFKLNNLLTPLIGIGSFIIISFGFLLIPIPQEASKLIEPTKSLNTKEINK